MKPSEQKPGPAGIPVSPEAAREFFSLAGGG